MFVIYGSRKAGNANGMTRFRKGLMEELGARWRAKGTCWNKQGIRHDWPYQHHQKKQLVQSPSFNRNRRSKTKAIEMIDPQHFRRSGIPRPWWLWKVVVDFRLVSVGRFHNQDYCTWQEGVGTLASATSQPLQICKAISNRPIFFMLLKVKLEIWRNMEN